MTLQEAIETLEQSTDAAHTIAWEEYVKALKLGIEALKRHKEDNKGGFGFIERPLPGETQK